MSDTHMRRPEDEIKQPIVHAGPHARDIMNFMIKEDYLKNAYKKPDNITFITAHNYVDDELGSAESKLHRHNELFDLDGKKVSIFERNLHHLGIGLPVVVSKPVCGHHETDKEKVEKYGMYAHLMKEQWILEYLENNETTELTMWCDAGDVIFQDDPQKINLEGVSAASIEKINDYALRINHKNKAYNLPVFGEFNLTEFIKLLDLDMSYVEDKAIYVSIPIDWIVGTPNKAKRRITLRPITRDGGAHLSSARKLYRYIEEAQFANFKREGGRLWK